MAYIRPKKPPPTTFPATLGPSVGTASDFWALAYCPEIDDLERDSNPNHSAFTWVFHYEPPKRTVVSRFPRRLDALHQLGDGTVIAAGNTLGFVEIAPGGLKEVSLANVHGAFTCMWGPSDDHVFATGAASPFVLYRRHEKWRELSLPEGAEDVRCVNGLTENDVYIVGLAGQVHHFDGQQLARLKVPVRTWLTGVARLDLQRVVVCGYGGTLLVGNRAGWRYVATHTKEPLLAVATLGGEAFFGVDGKVHATDTHQPSRVVLDYDATWVSSLRDGLVFSSYTDAKLYDASGALTDLDVTVNS